MCGGSLVFICWETLGPPLPFLTSASSSADWEQGPPPGYLLLDGQGLRAELTAACCPTWGRGTCLPRLHSPPCPGWALPLGPPDPGCIASIHSEYPGVMLCLK